MGVQILGLPPSLADAVTDACSAAGDGLPDAAVVGLVAPTGTALLDLDRAAWDEAVASARAAFLDLQAAARRLVAEGAGGSIAVVVPIHAVRPSAGCGVAAVVGSFLTTVAQVAAVELGPRGIRVNVVAVGPLEGEAPARTAEGVPLGRLTRPADVGAMCALLAGPGAAFVNGTVVAVDGGYAVTKAGGGSPFADA